MAMSEGVCKSCGAPVRWVVTANGRNMPLDRAPVRAFRIVTGVDGREVAEHAGDLFQSHFSTCPDAATHRRRGPA